MIGSSSGLCEEELARLEFKLSLSGAPKWPAEAARNMSDALTTIIITTCMQIKNVESVFDFFLNDYKEWF